MYQAFSYTQLATIQGLFQTQYHRIGRKYHSVPTQEIELRMITGICNYAEKKIIFYNEIYEIILFI